MVLHLALLEGKKANLPLKQIKTRFQKVVSISPSSLKTLMTEAQLTFLADFA